MKTRIIGAIVALVLAVVGAFALITYVRGADARAAAGAELRDVYVVQETIVEGTPGEEVAELVQLDSIPERNIADGAVTDLEDLAGLVADAELLPGEQLLLGRFVDPLELAANGDVRVPDGMQEVSFALPVQRMVGGAVQAGNTIGVVVTGPGDGAGIGTRFELDRVLVTKVAVGVTATTGGNDGAAAQQTGNMLMFTVALATHDVERLVWALEHAEKQSQVYGVWVTLQNEKTDTSGSMLTTESNMRR
ncbi:Flp pilus assembly protein CpaB [Agromyces sp. S2-1-8]|uniref:Flp pilus assembly protein CpaB n=1 Tax=Agromyces sp. S2-1-8 TaxID=2897180 RepID=UPI001E5142AA|nr:hypothetical protein [Agromyces sp. S2-1-8]MCD5344951.1 hypothetical protein [Agromyces sp. S2-1-8]